MVHWSEEFSMDYATYTGANPNYIVEALPVWKMNQEDSSKYSDRHDFKCPGCNAKLSLANHGNALAKRVYFRLADSKEEHAKSCEATNMALNEFNKENEPKLCDEGIISENIELNILFTQQTRNKIASTPLPENDDSLSDSVANNQKVSVPYSDYEAGKKANRHTL